jgi:hypothetical protein
MDKFVLNPEGGIWQKTYDALVDRYGTYESPEHDIKVRCYCYDLKQENPAFAYPHHSIVHFGKHVRDSSPAQANSLLFVNVPSHYIMGGKTLAMGLTEDFDALTMGSGSDFVERAGFGRHVLTVSGRRICVEVLKKVPGTSEYLLAAIEGLDGPDKEDLKTLLAFSEGCIRKGNLYVSGHDLNLYLD